jgi:hypothetical protein
VDDQLKKSIEVLEQIMALLDPLPRTEQIRIFKTAAAFYEVDVYVPDLGTKDPGNRKYRGVK